MSSLTFTAPDPGLAPLWSRAIASDTDKPQWLEKRRGGLTGTDMKIIARSRPQTVREHLRKKATGTDAEFRGNRATDWGNYREERIIADLDGTEYHRCGLLLVSEVNSRFLVTPDLMGVSFLGELEVIEVKTAEKKDLDPTGPDFAGTRYLEQILWEIIVTGAVRAILRVEQHDGDWSRWNDRPQGGRDFQEGFTLDDYGPHIVATHEYTFERSDYEAEIAAMIVKAEAALIVLDEELTGFVADGPETFTEVERREYGSAAREYADATELEKAAKIAKSNAKAELLTLAVEQGRKSFSDRFDNIKVTFSAEDPGEESKVGDVEAAKLAEPGAWNELEQAQARLTAAQDQWGAVLSQHQKTVVGKPSAANVTITPPRGGTR